MWVIILLCFVLRGTFDVYVSMAGGEPKLVCVYFIYIDNNPSLLPKFVASVQISGFSFGDSRIFSLQTLLSELFGKPLEIKHM